MFVPGPRNVSRTVVLSSSSEAGCFGELDIRVSSPDERQGAASHRDAAVWTEPKLNESARAQPSPRALNRRKIEDAAIMATMKASRATAKLLLGVPRVVVVLKKSWGVVEIEANLMGARTLRSSSTAEGLAPLAKSSSFALHFISLHPTAFLLLVLVASPSASVSSHS